MLDSPNSPDTDSRDGAEVLRFTLARVRQKRLRRRLRVAVLCPAAVVVSAMAILFHGSGPPDERPVAVVTGPLVPSRETPASLAVLVVRDGIPTLQTLSPEAFGGMELRFSLEPITADADQFGEMELSAAWPIP
jgi:hypothetical protein